MCSAHRAEKRNGGCQEFWKPLWFSFREISGSLVLLLALIDWLISQRCSNRTFFLLSVRHLSQVILSLSIDPSIPTIKSGEEVLQNEAGKHGCKVSICVKDVLPLNDSTAAHCWHWWSQHEAYLHFLHGMFFSFFCHGPSTCCGIAPFFHGVCDSLWQHVEALRPDLKALVEMRVLTLWTLLTLTL